MFMLINSYQKAKKIITENESLNEFIGGRFEELILKAEQKLNLKFSPSYLDFLKTFGAGNFGAEEIFGVIHDDFENSSVPDAIWYTLSERQVSSLPNSLLVIYDSGSDDLFCLNFNNLNDAREPRIVAYTPGVALKHQSYEVIADNFGDFLLDLVSQEI